MSEKTGKKERLESEGKPLPWHWLGILSIVVAVLSYMVYIRPDSSSNQCLGSDSSCLPNPSEGFVPAGAASSGTANGVVPPGANEQGKPREAERYSITNLFFYPNAPSSPK